MRKLTLPNIALVISCVLSLSVFAAPLPQQTAEEMDNSVHVKNNVHLLTVKQPDQLVLDTDKDQITDKHDQCPNTPTSNEVNQYGCSIYKKIIKEVAKTETVNEEIMTIKILINFDNDKFNVKAEYINEIERVAKFLEQYPQYSIIITGHTSIQGKASYNKTLSQQRANQISNVLITQFFIDKSRVLAVGYGEEKLLDESNTTEAHTMNRRVEGIVILTQ